MYVNNRSIKKQETANKIQVTPRTPQYNTTKSYCWKKESILGKGATSHVFSGRKMDTGDYVAVKCFTAISYSRPFHIMMREFEVLNKLKHKNIVRMLDCQEEEQSKQLVIIMELCNGSLYTLLEEPENYFGISEEEFLHLLKDIAEGMLYLKHYKIIHRDIKPGNIMWIQGEDGRRIYKLADFGAARELNEDQGFVSLYGTEEYLHPDLYERAVLRRDAGKMFSWTVDLWSLGVTLYHACAGKLPFRPYGGRRNKQMMYYMTTEKESGVISGIQKTEGAPIEWSRELPKTVQLSWGLKNLVTPILSGLMESKPEKSWNFNQFYQKVQELLDMHQICVFQVRTGKILDVYLEKCSKFAHFQDAIAAQTDIRAKDQSFVREGRWFQPDETEACTNYPRTSKKDPLFLVPTDDTEFPSMVPIFKPPIPKFGESLFLEADSTNAKACTAVIWSVERSAKCIYQVQILITKFYLDFRLLIEKELENLQNNFLEFKTAFGEVKVLLIEVETKVEAFEMMGTGTQILCSGIRSDIASKMCEYQQELIETIRTPADELHAEEKDISQELISLNGAFADITNFYNSEEHCWAEILCSDECLIKVKLKRKSAFKMLTEFKTNRSVGVLSSIEKQIHQANKVNIYEKCKEGMVLVVDCEANLKKMYKITSDWYSRAFGVRFAIQKLSEKIQIGYTKCKKLFVDITKMKEKIESTTVGLVKENRNIVGIDKQVQTVCRNEELVLPHLDESYGINLVENLRTKPKKTKIPEYLKTEMRIWKKEVKKIHEEMEEHTDIVKRFINFLDSCNKDPDSYFGFEGQR